MSGAHCGMRGGCRAFVFAGEGRCGGYGKVWLRGLRGRSACLSTAWATGTDSIECQSG